MRLPARTEKAKGPDHRDVRGGRPPAEARREKGPLEAAHIGIAMGGAGDGRGLRGGQRLQEAVLR